MEELDKCEYNQFESDDNVEIESETKSDNTFNIGDDKDESDEHFSETEEKEEKYEEEEVMEIKADKKLENKDTVEGV
jgi:glucan phosphorylase